MMPISALQDSVAYERTMGLRFTLFCAAVFWGVSLVIPPATFDRPAYRLMEDLMPEQWWAILFFAHAVALTLAYKGSMGRWLAVMAVHTIGAVMWGTVAFCMLTANGLIAAASTPNLALAVASLWVLAQAPSCPRKASHA